jgi:sarcosine oxidase subunit beta|tara:strand:- start:2645 stop:3778 length:1134 start_codon:yes stop_codon:yes gene_type:complete
LNNILIIGAGVIGLSCGYHLAQKGLKVTIVDKNEPGSGQSTRTGGGIRFLHGSKHNRILSSLSEQFWKKFHREFDTNPNYNEIGHLFLSAENEKINQLINGDEGKNFKILNSNEINSIWPHLNALSFNQGLYCKNGGYLNQHQVIKGLVRGFQKIGGSLLVGVRAKTLILSDGKVQGINSSIGPLTADITINCSGADVGDLTKYDNIIKPFKSRHHELIIVNSTQSIPKKTPWLIDLDKQVHLRSDGINKVLIGGFLGSNDVVESKNYTPKISTQWRDNVILAAHESFGLTGLNANVIKHWGGLYPGTKDYLPIIEKTQPGLMTAAGFSGTGLMHAPAVGMIISDLVGSGHTNKVDISVFDSKRFTKDVTIAEGTGF